jgi:DNA topoisomerase I
VKPGKYGPYVKRGDDTASVPDDLRPTSSPREGARAAGAPKSDEPIGELDDFPVFAKNGRYGPYVQWGSPDAAAAGRAEAEDGEPVQDDDARRGHRRRRRAAAAAAASRSASTPPTARRSSATTGATARTSSKGKDFRTIARQREQLFTITLDEALADLGSSRRCSSVPGQHGGRRSPRASSAPIR